MPVTKTSEERWEEAQEWEGQRRMTRTILITGFTPFPTAPENPTEVLIEMVREGEITMPEGVEMVMPGDNVNLQVELITPVALEQGGNFAIREGGLTVGAGVITEILD